MFMEETQGEPHVCHSHEPTGVQGSPGRGVRAIDHKFASKKQNEAADPRGHAARHLVLAPLGGYNRVELQAIVVVEALDLTLLRTGKNAVAATVPMLRQRLM